jgi:hypothetical protein
MPTVIPTLRVTVVTSLRKTRTASRLITKANSFRTFWKKGCRRQVCEAGRLRKSSRLMITSPCGPSDNFDDEQKTRFRSKYFYEWILLCEVFPEPSLPETTSLHQTAFLISFAAYHDDGTGELRKPFHSGQSNVNARGQCQKRGNFTHAGVYGMEQIRTVFLGYCITGGLS